MNGFAVDLPAELQAEVARRASKQPGGESAWVAEAVREKLAACAQRYVPWSNAMHKFQGRRNATLGQWTLLSKLGQGGNAEVWRAKSSEHPEVALKVLRLLEPTSEPYKRFREEIKILESLGGFSGVLPLLKSALPEHPTKLCPAWLAMPVATPIAESLGAQPSLTAVVSALFEISLTLERLSSKKSIYHRDIKPGNLYRYADGWVVGDFGLVAHPDKEDLTSPGRHIGPRYYLAPEIILGGQYDPGPADVYAIAKTLWVLATGQSYPPPGTLEADLPVFRISTYLVDPKSRPIELLLERSTHAEPSRRPTMSEFARELQAWLRPEERALQTIDIHEIHERVKPIIHRQRSVVDARDNAKKHVENLIHTIEPGLDHIGKIAGQALEYAPQYGAWCLFSDWAGVTEIFRMPNKFNARCHAMYIEVPVVTQRHDGRAHLISGIAFAILADKQVHMVAAHLVQTLASSGDFQSPSFLCAWSARRTAQMESALEDEYCQELMAGLSNSLPIAIEMFAQTVDAL